MTSVSLRTDNKYLNDRLFFFNFSLEYSSIFLTKVKINNVSNSLIRTIIHWNKELDNCAKYLLIPLQNKSTVHKTILLILNRGIAHDKTQLKDYSPVNFNRTRQFKTVPN